MIVGLAQCVKAFIDGAVPKNKQERSERIHDSIGGVGAESALATFHGVEWPQAHLRTWYSKYGGDVILPSGVKAECKSSPHPFTRKPVANPDDRLPVAKNLLGQKDWLPERPYYLVLPVEEDPLSWDIIGWLYGMECKREEWWDEKRGRSPCFWIHYSNLRSPGEMPVELMRCEAVNPGHVTGGEPARCEHFALPEGGRHCPDHQGVYA